MDSAWFVAKKRREYIDKIWTQLSKEEKDGLYSILLHGHPDGVTEPVWLKLRGMHLCDGVHFYDADGIRDEYLDLISEKFAGERQE